MELNQIFNIECLEGMKQIPNDFVDLIVTDPPYLIKYKTNNRKNKKHKFCSEILNDDNEQLIINYINECYRILKNDSAMYIFCSSKKIEIFKIELEKKFKIKNIIIWVKNNGTMGDLSAQFAQSYEMVILVNKGRKEFNGKRITDIWNFDRVNGNKQLHSNQKPLALIEQCIIKHSNENDIVFDGFMGSGTTAIACINTKRNYLGFELDKEYYHIALKRIEDHKIE